MEDFTQEAYIHLLRVKENQNFVFSPLSFHSALTLVYLGSTENSTTFTELKTALGGLVNTNLLKERYEKYVSFLKDQKSVSYGNHIWLKENYVFKEKYKKDVQKFLHTQISSIDFDNEDAKRGVNDWIANVTKGRIVELIDEFSPNTLMFIANAIHFKESWIHPFEDEIRGTKITEMFSLLDGQIMVDMIQQSSRTFKYQTFVSHDIEFESVIIPYKNEKFHMKIIMPRDKPSDLLTLEFFANFTNIKDLRAPDEFNLFRIVGKETKTEVFKN